VFKKIEQTRCQKKYSRHDKKSDGFAEHGLLARDWTISYSCVSPAGAVPQERDHANGDVWSNKQVKDTEIDTGGDTGIPVAHIILERGATHSTLCQYFGSCRAEKKDNAKDQFDGSQLHL
jgi:hypothetical protein